MRHAYAQQTLEGAKVVDERLQKAFASVRRENFLPPGPWPILQLRDGTYRNTPDANPAHLYTDDLIGIAPERGINNGQPRLHAELLSFAAIRAGEHVVHVGAGAGTTQPSWPSLLATTGALRPSSLLRIWRRKLRRTLLTDRT